MGYINYSYLVRLDLSHHLDSRYGQLHLDGKIEVAASCTNHLLLHPRLGRRIFDRACSASKQLAAIIFSAYLFQQPN
jgi:hypothetical protein